MKALYLFINALFKNSALKCQLVKFCICAEFLRGHKIVRKSNFETPKSVLTKDSSKQDMYDIVIMVNYIPGFNFFISCNVFNDI